MFSCSNELFHTASNERGCFPTYKDIKRPSQRIAVSREAHNQPCNCLVSVMISVPSHPSKVMMSVSRPHDCFVNYMSLFRSSCRYFSFTCAVPDVTFPVKEYDEDFPLCRISVHVAICIVGYVQTFNFPKFRSCIHIWSKRNNNTFFRNMSMQYDLYFVLLFHSMYFALQHNRSANPVIWTVSVCNW